MATAGNARPRALMAHQLAGALTLGVMDSFEVVGGVECDGLKEFGVEFARRNLGIPVHVRPAATWESARFLGYYRGIDAVFGNPPCSGFSTASSGMRVHGPGSEVNRHITEVVDIGINLGAKVVAVETVAAVLYRGNVSFVDGLRDHVNGRGYRLQVVALDYGRVGVPQRRLRAFLLVTRVNVTVGADDLSRSDPLTLADAISDLAGQPLGYDAGPYVSGPNSGYQEMLRDKAVRVYDNVDTPVDGSVRYLAPGQPIQKLPYELLPPSLKKKYDAKGGVNWWHTAYSGAAHRQRWDAPSNTVTGKPILVHPDHHRRITVRETARLMGIPDTFRFALRDGIKSDIWLAYKLVGKGVPVPAGRWIARVVARAIERNEPADHDGITDLRKA